MNKFHPDFGLMEKSVDNRKWSDLYGKLYKRPSLTRMIFK